MWKKTLSELNPIRNTENPPVIPDSGKSQALIGPSINIVGQLSGDEDVLIQGHIKGTVEFKKNSVTIGKYGRVTADICAREICVEGTLEGNIFSEQRATIRASGTVIGDISAPRVMMEDGAKFKGAIDMEPQTEKAALGKTVTSLQGKLTDAAKTKEGYAAAGGSN
ncbi:MAG: polymer-forming cytoskeletal protein [Pseudomonadota bacterium]